MKDENADVEDKKDQRATDQNHRTRRIFYLSNEKMKGHIDCVVKLGRKFKSFDDNPNILKYSDF